MIAGMGVVVDAEAADWRQSTETRRAGFIGLVETNHADLMRLAYGICGDADLAADAVQAAWQAAWRELDDVRDMAAVRSWLLSITANQARRLMRRRRLGALLEMRAFRSRVAPTLAAAADLDLATALSRLAPRDRELVTLRFGLGLTSEEIGLSWACPRPACACAWVASSGASVRN